MRSSALILVCVLGAGAVAAWAAARAGEAATAPVAVTIQHDADRLQWSEAPPPMPVGTRIAVLEGDPKVEGMFTVRLRVPAGAQLPPHWHPRDERVTVLSGRVGVGFGERFDASRLRFFGPGAYYVNPTPAVHFVFFPVESVVQVTGLGPWEVRPAPVPSGTPKPAP